MVVSIVFAILFASSAIIAVSDSIYGEIVKAFVVPLIPMQDSDIKDALKKKISILN